MLRVLNKMKSQVLIEYMQWMKSMRSRMVRIANTYAISLILFAKKPSSPGVQLKSTRNFNLSTDDTSLGCCFSYSITLVQKQSRFFYIYMSLHRSHFVRAFTKIKERKSIFLGN